MCYEEKSGLQSKRKGNHMTNIGNGCDDGCGKGFSFEKLAVDLPLIQSRLLQRVAWQDETGASEESVAEMAKTMDCLLPIAKDWFLWLVGQRVPAALKVQKCAG